MKAWSFNRCKGRWRPYAVTAATIAIVLLTQPAFAQFAVGGGGSSGLLAPILQWFGTNIVAGLIEVGVLGIGIAMLFQRFFMGVLAMMVVGALVIGNASTITALFPVSL